QKQRRGATCMEPAALLEKEDEGLLHGIECALLITQQRAAAPEDHGSVSLVEDFDALLHGSSSPWEHRGARKVSPLTRNGPVAFGERLYLRAATLARRIP